MAVKKWTVAVDLLKEAYGTLQMFAFILEEAQQSLGMAVYLSYQAGDKFECKELAEYAIIEIIDPALLWLDTYGYVIIPTNLSYKEFFLASKKSMERFISLCG